MKPKSRIFALMLVIIMMIAALSGCAGTPSESPKASGEATQAPAASATPDPNLSVIENELTVVVQGEVDDTKTLTTLIDTDGSPAFNGNPFDETAGANWSIQPFLFDYLAFFSPYPERTFKTSLLESYTYENRVATLKLLPDLKWSDGTPIDAEDLLTHYYCQVGRSTIWSYIDTIEKVDDLSIKITYCTDSDLLLNLTFNNPMMTPNEIYGQWAQQYKEIAENDREFATESGVYKYSADAADKLAKVNEQLLAYKPQPDEIVASGAYVIDKWNTSEILFKPNGQYRKQMLIKSIRGLRPGDSQAFATAILSNEYTIENGGLSSDMSAQIDAKYADTLRKVYVPELSSIGYSFNTNIYPLNIPQVRKAISMMVDKPSLINVAEPGSFMGDPRNSGLLPSLQGAYTDEAFLSTLTDYSYNPEEAAKLLESVGWKFENGKWLDDKGESPLISIATINSWPTFMMTGEAMSTMLSEQGLNIEFKPMEFGVWNEFTKNDEEKMIVCTFIASSPTYAHPWESFNEYFLTNTRAGFGKLEAGQDRVFTLPTTGEQVNVTELLHQLYTSQDEAKTRELVQKLMTIGNDMCGYMSIVEKTAPMRIYDPKLSLADTELNEVQRNYYYYGNLNNALAKMMADDLVYFVK